MYNHGPLQTDIQYSFYNATHDLHGRNMAVYIISDIVYTERTKRTKRYTLHDMNDTR